MFPNAIACVPSDEVENDMHRSLPQTKPSLKDPRVWVGHCQPEDLVCFADSDGVAQLKRISKKGMTKRAYPVKSKDQLKPPRPTARLDGIVRSQWVWEA